MSYSDADQDGKIDIAVMYADLDGDGDFSHEIREVKNYYPFGLQHKSPNGNVVNGRKHNYGFGGVEENYIGGSLLDLDFGVRMYDPAIARWMVIDPLADAMRRHSPYNYAFDNPVFYIDPDGMMPIPGFNEEQDTPHGTRNVDMFGNLPGNIIAGNADGNGSNGPGDPPQHRGEDTVLGAENVLDEVVINGSSTSDYDANAPASIKNSDASYTSDYDGSLADYNIEHGTSFTQGEQYNQYYYQFFYKPELASLVGGIHDATNTAAGYVMDGALMLAPLPKIGLVSRGLKFVSSLRVKPLVFAGKRAGFTISQGSKYGARARLDFHALGRASKASNSITTPNFLKNRKLFHYHRGRGNNLQRHRPWEKGWNDKNFWSRF